MRDTVSFDWDCSIFCSEVVQGTAKYTVYVCWIGKSRVSSLSRQLLCVCQFKGKSTMLNDEVCTLYSFEWYGTMLRNYMRFHFHRNLGEGGSARRTPHTYTHPFRFSMTNNDNSSDNNINLHHGNNDLQTIRNTTILCTDDYTQHTKSEILFLTPLYRAADGKST